MEAPRAAGSYELRYITGQSNRTLAKTAVVVAPSGEPAKLRVLTDAKDATGAFAAAEFVLDASGSMLQKLGGDAAHRPREERADRSRERTRCPTALPFALRVFGHKEAGSCRTDLELPLAPLDRTRRWRRSRGSAR